MTAALTETYTNDTGTWGWTEDGQLYCSTCHGEQDVTCTACQGNTCQTCECDKPECDTCDNTGHLPCPTCER